MNDRSDDDIAWHDQATEKLGEADDRDRMRPTLRVVTREDTFGTAPLDHPGELPPEIRRIAQARDEPLPGKRRRNMRCIAREKHATALKAFDCARVETIDRLAFNLRLLAVGPGTQQFTNLCVTLHLRRILAGQQHEFPPLTSARCNHVGTRPARVADELCPVDGFRRMARIDDEPVLRVRRALEVLASSDCSKFTSVVPVHVSTHSACASLSRNARSSSGW